MKFVRRWIKPISLENLPPTPTSTYQHFISITPDVILTTHLRTHHTDKKTTTRHSIRQQLNALLFALSQYRCFASIVTSFRLPNAIFLTLYPCAISSPASHNSCSIIINSDNWFPPELRRPPSPKKKKEKKVTLSPACWVIIHPPETSTRRSGRTAPQTTMAVKNEGEYVACHPHHAHFCCSSINTPKPVY